MWLSTCQATEDVEKIKELDMAPVCRPCVCDLVNEPTTIADLIVSMLQLGAALARTADHFDASTTIRPPLRAT
jgi:hypothetical protein